MASSYSDLKIELIATGEQSGSWGNTTNTNLGTALEEAITGRAEANFDSDADLTLGYTDANTTQAFRNLILNVTGTISTTRNLIVPTIDKQYLIENNTTGGQSITVKTSAGTGVTVPNGVKAHVYADGTNVVQAVDYLPTADIDGGSIDGVTIGTNSAATEVQIDNLNINGNTISSTDTDGNIAITPDGTGEVDISKVDIASGEIDGTNIGANSAGTGNFSTLSIAGTAITSTATELNILDGATVSTAEINYLDITALGAIEASKAVTADSNGEVQMPDDKKLYFGSDDDAHIMYDETTDDRLEIGGAPVFVEKSTYGTVTAENDGSFDISAGNFYTCTPTGTIDLTFTNIVAGQAGAILLVNTTPQTVTVDADVFLSAADLTAINEAGTYLLGFYSPDGTNVYMSATPALTEGS